MDALKTHRFAKAVLQVALVVISGYVLARFGMLDKGLQKVSAFDTRTLKRGPTIVRRVDSHFCTLSGSEKKT